MSRFRSVDERFQPVDEDVTLSRPKLPRTISRSSEMTVCNTEDSDAETEREGESDVATGGDEESDTDVD